MGHFAASTLVAVPGGRRAIAALKVGDKVTAYDPHTGKTSTQTVEATYINHDTDLLDVTLRVSASNASSSSTAPAAAATTTIAKHASTAAQPASETAHEETIHTTANHPWLTADRGWTLADSLQVGEPVHAADGATAIVAAVRVVPGAARAAHLLDWAHPRAAIPARPGRIGPAPARRRARSRQ